MNKLLMFPLAVLACLVVYAVISTGQHYNASMVNYTDLGEDVSDSGRVFDIWSFGGALIILLTAISIGVLSGIHGFGFGLSEHSQHIIFNSTIWIGIWASLSYVSLDFLFEEMYTTVIWMSLTLMFIMGVAFTISGTEGN